MENEKAEVTYSDQSEGKNTANTMNVDDDSQSKERLSAQPGRVNLQGRRTT